MENTKATEKLDTLQEKKLQVRDLRISFRTVSGKLQAVRGISFDLNKGETLAIVGESGSGKSVTSKAILGILAGNSIVEGGEILYDGQDLLKINEDDFYKLRGDKIAMIFQDPLSSLNPIMRIGKQLTEAMLLKGKARQRACKDGFFKRSKLLEEYMVAAQPERAGEIKEKCELFRKFEMRHIRMEQSYNDAYESAQEAIIEIENALFLIEKNAFKNPRPVLRQIKTFAEHSKNTYVVNEDAQQLDHLAGGLLNGIRTQEKNGDFSSVKAVLDGILTILKKAVDKEKPEFMAMGYYQETNNGTLREGDVKENNAFYVQYMDEHFLNDFEKLAEAGVAHNDRAMTEKRREAVEKLKAALGKLIGDLDLEDSEDEDIDKKLETAFQTEDIKAMAEDLRKTVDASIDPIDIVKDSAACTFSSSLKYYVNTYNRGLRTNARKIARYEKQMKRYNKKLERKKQMNYTVPEPQIVNLPLTRKNIAQLISGLQNHYEAVIEQDAGENKYLKAERLIDNLKENASGMVLKITKQAAKNKALKLMEEVGISEPRKRYRQYPFEFSGGMRQRIVIAIALAANPDILICDEPTTALDVTIQAQILELINKLKAERNLSIIFITHDLGVVANMADKIAVMYAGKIIEYGTANEVFYEPAHPYTWALLASMPNLDTKDKLDSIPGTPPNMIYPPKGDAFAERNRYAMQIDFEEEPPAFPISETHWAATWLLHPDAPKVDPPKAVTERIASMKAKAEERENA